MLAGAQRTIRTSLFYFGFLCSAIMISLCKGNKSNVIRYSIVTIGIGLPIQHLFGVLFMCFYNGFQMQTAILTVSLPFVLGYIIKCILASILAIKLNKVLRFL